MYKSIRIQNFRGLRDLAIDDLGRVNLIVGENNVGKTSLLEAIWLLQQAGNALEPISIAHSRGPRFASVTDGIDWQLFFYGVSSEAPITIEGRTASDKGRRLRIAPTKLPGRRAYPTSGDYPGSPRVIRDEIISYAYEADQTDRSDPGETSNQALKPEGTFFLSARREVSLEELAVQLAWVVERGLLDRLVEDLQPLLPTLKQLSVERATPEQPPTILGDIGLARPLPLPLLGEGVVWLLEILLALLTTRGGVVLIDEVEHGLYAHNFAATWHAIERASNVADVQIFATTHSWECIEAAIEAFDEQHAHDFRLHRLERKDERNRVVTYAHDVAQAALEIPIEVR
jgi:hypothetical protein